MPGGKQPIERDVKEERVTLIPNQKEYKPGETAEILVQSPFSPADGFLTVRAGGIVDKQAIHIEDGSISVKVAIKAEYMPSVAVVVDLTGAAARARDDGEPDDGLPKRPAFASGSVGLSVPPLERPATPNEPGDDDGGDEYERPRGRHWGWWGPWYQHDNLRDERVEAFTSILYGGVYSYTYTARATTPVNFVAPPTKAEEMYMPETFGRSGSDRVIVE